MLFRSISSSRSFLKILSIYESGGWELREGEEEAEVGLIRLFFFARASKGCEAPGEPIEFIFFIFFPFLLPQSTFQKEPFSSQEATEGLFLPPANNSTDYKAPCSAPSSARYVDKMTREASNLLFFFSRLAPLQQTVDFFLGGREAKKTQPSPLSRTRNNNIRPRASSRGSTSRRPGP